MALSRKKRPHADVLECRQAQEEQATPPMSTTRQLTPQQQALADNFDGEFHHGDVYGFSREERKRRGFHMSIMDVRLPGEHPVDDGSDTER